jgi:hypothetical protein
MELPTPPKFSGILCQALACSLCLISFATPFDVGHGLERPP